MKSSTSIYVYSIKVHGPFARKYFKVMVRKTKNITCPVLAKKKKQGHRYETLEWSEMHGSQADEFDPWKWGCPIWNQPDSLKLWIHTGLDTCSQTQVEAFGGRKASYVNPWHLGPLDAPTTPNPPGRVFVQPHIATANDQGRIRLDLTNLIMWRFRPRINACQ